MSKQMVINLLLVPLGIPVGMLVGNVYLNDPQKGIIILSLWLAFLMVYALLSIAGVFKGK